MRRSSADMPSPTARGSRSTARGVQGTDDHERSRWSGLDGAGNPSRESVRCPWFHVKRAGLSTDTSERPIRAVEASGAKEP